MRIALSPSLLRRRIADGARISDIAVELGVHRSTIKRHCATHGIDLPVTPGPRRRSPTTEEIIARIEVGETASSIARSAGVSHSAIVRALERAGYRLLGGVITRMEDGNA